MKDIRPFEEVNINFVIQILPCCCVNTPSLFSVCTFFVGVFLYLIIFSKFVSDYIKEQK